MGFMFSVKNKTITRKGKDGDFHLVANVNSEGSFVWLGNIYTAGC